MPMIHVKLVIKQKYWWVTLHRKCSNGLGRQVIGRCRCQGSAVMQLLVLLTSRRMRQLATLHKGQTEQLVFIDVSWQEKKFSWTSSVKDIISNAQSPKSFIVKELESTIIDKVASTHSNTTLRNTHGLTGGPGMMCHLLKCSWSI